jgi:hypothetical protein
LGTENAFRAVLKGRSVRLENGLQGSSSGGNGDVRSVSPSAVVADAPELRASGSYPDDDAVIKG